MTNEDLGSLLGLLIFIFIIFLVNHLIKKHKYNIRIVKENSEQYKKIITLNQEYEKIFLPIQNQYNFCKWCKSKSQLDRLELRNFLQELIESDIKNFTDILNRNKFNTKKYLEYKNKYQTINSTITKEQTKNLKIKYETFIKLEQKYCKKIILNPITESLLYCEGRYISPAGRNSYLKEKYFDSSDIEYALLTHQKKKEFQQSKAYQRTLMTDSLRYDIMKRDGFKCQLCGASSHDGVKLHVDHIIPVSKGGKTIPSNLRTLCDRCNLGKRDKLETF